MTATTTTPRYVLGAGNELRGLLVPETAGAVPKIVRVASDEASRTYAVARQAGIDERGARGELERAPALDRQRDAEALAAGEPLPTRRAEDAAREALALAHRRTEAAEHASRAQTLELARTIHREREAWLGRQRALVDRLASQAAVAADELLDALAALHAERDIQSCLESFPPHGSLILSRFQNGVQDYSALRVAIDQHLG